MNHGKSHTHQFLLQLAETETLYDVGQRRIESDQGLKAKQGQKMPKEEHRMHSRSVLCSTMPVFDDAGDGPITNPVVL